jgi:iron complex outermembrane recepter protein
MNPRVPAALPGILFSILTLGGTYAAQAGESRSLSDLSLDELMDVPVTSVSRRETRRGDAATAITVITQEDIRRAGITALPEALRLAPGLDVARIDGSHWAISARGFNLQYANTLLVLVDGLSVYSPAFGGVYWDAQDLPLQDIERIEVIRGPGAALWGANAVNGVINIISRRARDTQGLAVATAVGTGDRPSAEARYGGSIGSSARYRVYGKYSDRVGLDDPSGLFEGDDWTSARVGFRTDWDSSEERLVTLQGDYYSLRSDHVLQSAILTPPFTQASRYEERADGGNLLARWTQALSASSELSVQSYIDSYDRNADSRDTFDIELQHRFVPMPRHNVVWGAGYRGSREDLHLAFNLITEPARRTSHLYTAFAQDEIALSSDRLRLTLGMKLESNDVTGTESQPNIRLLYSPDSRHSAWASASRAVSTPSRFYTHSRFSVGAFQVPDGPVTEIALMPDPDVPSQKLDAFELGYRLQTFGSFSADIAAFHNDYDQIYSPVADAPQFVTVPFPHLVLPYTWRGVFGAESYGAEIEASWQPNPAWRLTGTYSWLSLRVQGNSALGTGSPEHQFALRSNASLSPKLELTASAAYVDSIDAFSSTIDTAHIPSYVRFDAGLIYRPFEDLEIGLWGPNLLDPSHGEISGQDSATVSEVPRGVLLKITVRLR